MYSVSTSKKKYIGKRLKQERMLRGLSQEDLARLIDTEPRNISRWENNRSTPQPLYRRKLAELFKIQISDLYIETEHHLPEQANQHTENVTDIGAALHTSLDNSQLVLFIEDGGIDKVYAKLLTGNINPKIYTIARTTWQNVLTTLTAYKYDLLEKEEQKLFRRLGIFAGTCTIDAASEVCNFKNISELRKTLYQLRTHNLVTVTNEFINMHPIQRLFAREKLREEESDWIRTRYIDYYYQLVTDYAKAQYYEEEESTQQDLENYAKHTLSQQTDNILDVHTAITKIQDEFIRREQIQAVGEAWVTAFETNCTPILEEAANNSTSKTAQTLDQYMQLYNRASDPDAPYPLFNVWQTYLDHEVYGVEIDESEDDEEFTLDDAIVEEQHQAPEEISVDVSIINIGDTIGYHLAPYWKPKDPMKVWHGRVKIINFVNQTVYVEVLDDGYNGIDQVEARYIVEYTPLQEPQRSTST